MIDGLIPRMHRISLWQSIETIQDLCFMINFVETLSEKLVVSMMRRVNTRSNCFFFEKSIVIFFFDGSTDL